MNNSFCRHSTYFRRSVDHLRSSALVVILLIACIAPIQSPIRISAQSCATFNDCHAVVDWQGLVIGSYTALYVAPMYDNNATGFINNEMWLIDSGTPSCQTSATLDCLVEAGYQATGGGVQYFVEEHYTYQQVFHMLGYIPRTYAVEPDEGQRVE